MTTEANHRGRADDLTDRRSAFVSHLHALHSGLTSDNGHVAAQARAELAVLRRSFVGPRQQMDAYGTVFEYGPPESEQGVWLLVGGLFALHPQPRRGNSDRKTSVGTAMGTLSRGRAGAVRRRFTLLASVNGLALEHHLRQSVQLLRSHAVPLGYETLLADLITLLADDPHGYRTEDRQRVRLRWARDFHRDAGQTDEVNDSLEDNE